MSKKIQEKTSRSLGVFDYLEKSLSKLDECNFKELGFT
jgi:hypothetical protein